MSFSATGPRVKAPAMREALDILGRGGVLVYPTETLYAVGCGAFFAPAVERVSRIKGRPADKPLPLLIGDISQLRQVTEFDSPEFRLLTARFWPGPLSIVVPATDRLPTGVQDGSGRTSVRLTAHPLAAALSRGIDQPLVATSANFSGRPAAATPDALEPGLLALADGALLERPWPGGGPASTVIRLEPDGRASILRQGAISPVELAAAGGLLMPRDGDSPNP